MKHNCKQQFGDTTWGAVGAVLQEPVYALNQKS